MSNDNVLRALRISRWAIDALYMQLLISGQTPMVNMEAVRKEIDDAEFIASEETK